MPTKVPVNNQGQIFLFRLEFPFHRAPAAARNRHTAERNTEKTMQKAGHSSRLISVMNFNAVFRR
jgi:hypothetical protein